MTNESIGLSLNGQLVPVNKDIIVVFTPSNEVVSYSYILYKDGLEVDSLVISSSDSSNITMNETGVYKLVITTKNELGTDIVINSEEYHIDKEKPVLTINNNLVTVKKGETFDVMSGVKAYDNISGDLINSVTSNYNELDFDVLGLKELVYTVSDDAGNLTTKTININVVKGVPDSLIYIQFGIVLGLIVALFMISSLIKSIRLERRISKYSIESINGASLSWLDKFQKVYFSLIFKISSLLDKSVFVKRYAKKYDKYTVVSYNEGAKGIDLVSTKLLVSFIFLIVAFISKVLQYQMMNGYEMIVLLVIGFFMPDIVFIYKYKLYRSKLENDLLQAIIVMNNAFKSGRSITQAIEMVSNELHGPIAEEFKKMHLEMTFGLEVSVVFDRFAERIKLEEVNHLTASLSILNKTGGNIIKVFSSIEKSLFSKKRLKLELIALIASSKMIVYVLFLVPLLFVVLVSIINPNYFLPFFTTPIGIILFIFMVIYYIIYVIIVQKVMRVRM